MNDEDDIYYLELKKLKYYCSEQPDKKVKDAIIKEPYKKYYLKSLKLLKKLLKLKV
jgi:hypothetical protein